MLPTQPPARKISGMDHNVSLAPSAPRAQETIKLIDGNLGNKISHLPKRANHGFRLSAEYGKKRGKGKKNKEDIAALNSCHNEKFLLYPENFGNKHSLSSVSSITTPSTLQTPSPQRPNQQNTHLKPQKHDKYTTKSGLPHETI
jgi:hypothetical protein